MASGWVKSLQCKSRALDDVVNNHHHYHLLPNSSSCRKGVQGLKDVVETTKKTKPRKPKPAAARAPQPPPKKRPVSRVTDPGPNTERSRVSSTASAVTSTRHSRAKSTAAESFFPALTELPEGHPSRNVVEIIFQTSWSPKVFSGRIEMVFKVQNLPRTVTRFEEYREVVKSRAGNGGGEDHARCIADGNEMMRFYCLGPTNGGAYEDGGGAWTFNSGKGAAVCTYSGSGGAHESAGGGRGRRAMLVCRVIAGRVCNKQVGLESLLEKRVGYDSVSGDKSELLVFDSRAVLPCFLIIYKL